MGPSTGVSLTPPRRRRERTSSTRFRVATSMRWKFIVPTRTCRICSLLRFDGKKWCFSRLSNSSSPLPFPDRSFFDRFKRSASIQMTGPSHAACNNGCDLLPVRSLSRCSLLCRRGAGAWSLEHARAFVWLARDCFWPEVALQWRSCTQMLQLRSWPCTQRPSRVGSEATRSASAQRHSRCRILSQNVQLSTNDRAFARRVSRFTCTTWVRSLHTPKSMFFTCPNISHSWKQETLTTTTLNSKNER